MWLLTFGMVLKMMMAIAFKMWHVPKKEPARVQKLMYKLDEEINVPDNKRRKSNVTTNLNMILILCSKTLMKASILTFTSYSFSAPRGHTSDGFLLSEIWKIILISS